MDCFQRTYVVVVMGVSAGQGGQGGQGHGARPPSHAAYYVALAGVLALLLLLLCYFGYFCAKRVKELVQEGYSTQTPAASYPVQPVVRDSASAMAKICKQLPSAAVFPTPPPPAATAHATPSPPHVTSLDAPPPPPYAAHVTSPDALRDASPPPPSYSSLPIHKAQPPVSVTLDVPAVR